MQDFTPGTALLGGLIIGASASLFLVLNGRVAGISGIVGGLLQASGGGRLWRTAFIAGLIAAPLLYAAAGGALPSLTLDSSPAMLVAAGLLVGFGARLGSGCTSGHGVCGIARGSRRSLAATLIFMTSAVLTVFVTRHLVGA